MTSLILPAPEDRRIEAQRGHAGNPPHVALIDRAGREVVMAPESALQTGALLCAGGALASSTLHTVNAAMLLAAIERELHRQVTEAQAPAPQSNGLEPSAITLHGREPL